MKTIIVMPAYNAEKTLEKTIDEIPFDYVDEIILIDDSSNDDTIGRAHSLIQKHSRLVATPTLDKVCMTIKKNPANLGYGGNQKSCYSLALKRGADIVVMVHPDYQYDPKIIKYFVEFISEGRFDVMLGTRIRSRKEAMAGGMPAYKYFANRALSFVQNLATGLTLTEWHTGMRAYRREVLEKIEYEKFSDDFIFDTQALFSIIENDYLIGEIPVPVRYFKEASSINFKRSCRYGMLTLWETSRFLFKRWIHLLKYILVGLMGVATNLGVYALLIFHTHIWYVSASILAFSCGIVISFTLQKYWTFKSRSTESVHKELMAYLALTLLNLAVNSQLLYVFVEKFSFNRLLGNILSNGIVAVWSYFVYKYLIFRNPRSVKSARTILSLD